VLKKNGDYVRTSLDHEQRCKADPKSYFRGWTEYSCSTGFAPVKSTQKWTIDEETHMLGLSVTTDGNGNRASLDGLLRAVP